jgi:HSP20 family protein
MDLIETGEHYVLRADLPGLSDEDVSVQFEDNVLTIFGERKAERETQQEGYYRIERSSGGFSRSLTLPEGIDPDGVQAHFDRGVLEIRIPKPEQTKPRQVQISLGTRPMHRDTIASAETGQP